MELFVIKKIIKEVCIYQKRNHTLCNLATLRYQGWWIGNRKSLEIPANESDKKK
jgi:hypothetical protein